MRSCKRERGLRRLVALGLVGGAVWAIMGISHDASGQQAPSGAPVAKDPSESKPAGPQSVRQSEVRKQDGSAEQPGDKEIPLREISEPQPPPGVDPTKLKIEVLEEKHPNGTLKSRMEGYRDKDGDFFRHGLTQEWNESGQLKLEAHFVHDVPHGRRTAFYPNGQTMSEGSYVNGYEHGKYARYFPDGKPMTVWTFHMGAWHGLLTEYHRTGHKRLEVEFVNGRRQGPQYQWDENGQLQQTTDFEDGIEQP